MHGPFSARRAHAAHPTPGDPPATATEEPPRLVATLPGRPCPRCETPLIDPDSLGLCPRCGYCRSLAQAPPLQTVPRAAPRWASALGLVGFWQLLCLLPAGTWLVLGATLTVLPLSYLADHRLAAASRERAVWSAVQLGVGVAVMLAGQAWTFSLLRLRRERVSLVSVLFPLELWPTAFRWLPDTREALCLTAGGLATILSAVLWVGGLMYWVRL
jgi:hypothetical protein